MKKLAVDWSELEMAFDNSSYEIQYYLDRESGEVHIVTEEARSTLERIYEENYDPQDEESFDLAAILQEQGVRDWQREMILEADRIESLSGSQMASIPTIPTYEAYNDMERFVWTVDDEDLEEQLSRAIRGRGAFRRFKDVLYDHPQERERWFDFKAEQVRERIRDWLHEQGIEPLE